MLVGGQGHLSGSALFSTGLGDETGAAPIPVFRRIKTVSHRGHRGASLLLCALCALCGHSCETRCKEQGESAPARDTSYLALRRLFYFLGKFGSALTSRICSECRSLCPESRSSDWLLNCEPIRPCPWPHPSFRESPETSSLDL